MTKKLKCIICGEKFEPKRITRNRLSEQVTCSHACHCKQKQQVNYRYWTKEEVQFLRSQANCGPHQYVARNYNIWAAQNGHSTRTVSGVVNKLRDLGLGNKAKYDMVPLSTVGRRLGISVYTVQNWPSYGLKTCEKFNTPARRYTTERHLVSFAKKKPECFGGIPYSRLYNVLGDEELAASIRKNYPNRPGSKYKARKCILLQTGVVYSSLWEAAKANHVCRTTVYKSCKWKRPLAGLDFRYCNDFGNERDVK